MKSIFSSVLLFGLTCFATCTFAQNSDRPDFHIGDRLSYQHTNGLANEKNYTQIEERLQNERKQLEIQSRTPDSAEPTKDEETKTPDSEEPIKDDN